MEVKEFMIGDLVLINKHPVHLTMQDLVYVHQGRECEPIPLTAEILAKNGWVYDTEYHNWWHEGVEFVIFCNEDNPHCYYVNSISSIHLDYIHSLQHILRLCGLNELADNFQI